MTERCVENLDLTGTLSFWIQIPPALQAQSPVLRGFFVLSVGVISV